MKQPTAVSSPLTGKQERTTEKKRSAQMFWKRYFFFYDTLNEAAPYRQMVERHAAHLDVQPGELILDAGTGSGNVAVILLAQGARVVGIDFCEPALEICRQKDSRGDFRFGDLTQRLELATDSFDKVSCCNVFQFLDPAAHASAFSELFRVLKPGGLFAVTVFATGFRSSQVYFETLRERRKSGGLKDALFFTTRYSLASLKILYYVWRIKKREKSGDYYFFSRDELQHALEQSGFEVLQLHSVFASQCITAVARKPDAAATAHRPGEDVD